MFKFAVLAQVVVALSVVYVWVVRLPNVQKEFHEYGIPDLLRNIVGATKIALSTLLIAGIWYPSLVLIPAALMALLMLCAQGSSPQSKASVAKVRALARPSAVVALRRRGLLR